jgi:DNA-binding PadR family transcriptional regulator
MVGNVNMADSKPRPAQKCFRMSEHGKLLLAQLSEKLGVNETAVVELAIRSKAKEEGIKIEQIVTQIPGEKE